MEAGFAPDRPPSTPAGDAPGRGPGVAAPLPYGPVLTRLLEPLRQAFLVVNRWATAPALRLGLGPLLGTPATGSLLVLRTRGRKTGLVREAPLGYALVDGAIVVVAGYGRAAHWFRNALANPEVEVVLPGAILAGRAEEIRDPIERRVAFRQVIAALGVVGRLTVGDVAGATDERVDALAEAFPVLRVRPLAVRPGPYDPGGGFWRVLVVATLGGAAALVAAYRRGRRP